MSWMESGNGIVGGKNAVVDLALLFHVSDMRHKIGLIHASIDDGSQLMFAGPGLGSKIIMREILTASEHVNRISPDQCAKC